MAFKATVRGVMGIDEASGDTIFDVLITHPITIDNREEDAQYPRMIIAGSSESLEQAIEAEVEAIKSNLAEEQHPAVGSEFTF
jgi:hypothetical protein